ncbi:pyridoxamine 5'-phosphate oxidase family protein [Nocardioides sp. YIM 152315]|uniref:pyridoxamine 5'-phosphate oxidase family protein n=1 Tax=Nocardioides sp. YIM 152315 TaxID=3031760 RepID=UPI0023DCB597|nr:pyridoxamine 5'-phosphate oxidase family protein [Nocardioides sp. YIM 152315]MDF1602497.1 pyridoxamine 5'-phosphate oxidase family protein [Nocardioides sp. YIM 152315]
MDDLVEHAADLLARNAYLTLGTVGPDQRPWTSPVYFTADGLCDFYWMSTQESRHSQHVAQQPAVSLVVFDSTVPPYHGRALYAEATAEVLEDADLAQGLTVYPGPPARGGTRLTAADVSGSSPWRLYRARAGTVWVLCPREPRQPCRLHGRNADHRVHVWPDAGE